MDPQNAACISLAVGLGVMALFGFVGYAMGRPKGLGGVGLILGALLGIIGLLIVHFMSGSPPPAYRVRARRPVPRLRPARLRRPAP